MMTAVDFAAYLYRAAVKKGKEISITKIQKWLFICYGLHLAVSADDEPPLFEELPRCWPYGPVFSSVFTHQKDKKADFSDVCINEQDFQKYDYLIDATLEHWGDWSARQLSDWSHRPGSAWDLARALDPYAPQRVSLQLEDIRNEFRGYLVHE